MASLNEIVSYLDETLDVATIPDYSAAYNGLQMQNSGQVGSVVAAVDASEAVIQEAVQIGADLLIVHHGMFWFGVQKITDAVYRKLKLAMDHDLAIYSAHIPLDIHPEYGNNVLLANELGMVEAVPYGDYKGAPKGVKQELAVSLRELLQKVEDAVGAVPHYCPGYRDLEGDVGMVGIITGGAGTEIQEMHELGINTFITGEGPHWSYPLAEELGMNVVYAGHYATETFGVKKMASLVSQGFEVELKEFIDRPTGL